jgi:hypothetical protein
MRSIKILVSLLKGSGLFLLIGGFLLCAIQYIFARTFSLHSSLSNINFLIIGAVAVCLAHGLEKAKKWAWYSGAVLFTFGIFQGLIATFYKSPIYVVNLLLGILCISLLINGKKQFLEQQTREYIFQWFREPCFIMVLVGSVISYLIALVTYYLQD